MSGRDSALQPISQDITVGAGPDVRKCIGVRWRVYWHQELGPEYLAEKLAGAAENDLRPLTVVVVQR